MNSKLSPSENSEDIENLPVQIDHRDFKLSHHDAQAGSSDESILGEEDPGSALESLVSDR